MLLNLRMGKVCMKSAVAECSEKYTLWHSRKKAEITFQNVVI